MYGSFFAGGLEGGVYDLIEGLLDIIILWLEVVWSRP